MKKRLSIILVLCVLIQSLGLAAFADDGFDEEPVELPAAVEETVTEELPAEEPSEENPEAEEPAGDPDEEDPLSSEGEPVVVPTDDEAEDTGEPETLPAEVEDETEESADLEAESEDEVPDEAEDACPALARLAAGSVIYGDPAFAASLYAVEEEAVVYALEEQDGVYRIHYNCGGELCEGFVTGDCLAVLNEDEAAAWQSGEHSDAVIFDDVWALEPVVIPGMEEEPGEEEDEMELMSDPADFVIVGTVLMEYKGTASAVTIPSSVKTINPYCFANHGEIISITIPDSVTKIGEGAFSGCLRLTGVSLPSGVTKIEPNTFKGCAALANISWSPVTEIGENAFEGCTSLHGVALPSSLKTIQGYAFANCRGITAVDFPANLESIYDNAFSNCTGLAQVLLGSCTKLTKLGGCAFQGCSAINKLELPPKLTEIENFAFQYCVSLTEVVIPNKVTKIDREAFSGCRSLKAVMIPASVDQILTQAFANVGGGCAFIMASDLGKPSIMGDNCIQRGSIVYGWHHMPVDNPELYCNQNGVTFYRIQVILFAERCYSELLKRSGDLTGIVYWANQLASKSLTGAQCISNFVNSAEFKSQNLSNTEIVTRLYKTMLDRAPDSAGLADWKNLLDNGVSVDYVVNGFANAPEFNHIITGICAKYGIVAGSLKLTQARDQNPNITAFVARCYKFVLNRAFDVDGLNFWCGNILYNNLSGAVLVDSFVNSTEFRDRGLSYEDQVEILYQTMLNRASDSTGKTDWVNYLKNYGVTIRNIVSGFGASREFRILCKTYGINPGALSNLEPRDQNRLVTRFVVECFRWTYNPGEYTPSPNDLNYYTQQILSRSKTPAQMAHDFAFSRDCVERNLSNKDFIVMLYHIYLGRETDPSPAEYNPWVIRLANGLTREQAAAEFAKTSEYYNYLKIMGLV